MKIAIVSAFYSEGMGYSENCLPKALAALGHEVHLVTSNLNVYGNSPDYNKSYASFLGPPQQEVGNFIIDGYTVHRLPSRILFGYAYLTHLFHKIKELSPDIIQTTEVASFHSFLLAIFKPVLGYKLFAETHQHLSVIKPYLRNTRGHSGKRLLYKLTRTFPTYLASKAIEKCYAIAPDCGKVANTYYGVSNSKIKLQPLGTDTDLFKPASSVIELNKRLSMRNKLGYSENDVVCIYTGRFSDDKNPLILAKAINLLSSRNFPFCGLFIGDGPQKGQLKTCSKITVLPFMKHTDLADYYRLADIAVWPTQESISMLDAASCGLPLIVSNKIGEIDRIIGNGKVYDGNIVSLSDTILSFLSIKERLQFGQIGRMKMVNQYSWIKVAKDVEGDYLSVI